jgi:hypothetical protein
MQRIILILALFSAFFVSSEPDLNTGVSPHIEYEKEFVACSGGVTPLAKCESDAKSRISAWCAGRPCKKEFKIYATNGGNTIVHKYKIHKCESVNSQTGQCEVHEPRFLDAGYQAYYTDKAYRKCPSPQDPEHVLAFSPTGDDNIMCYKPKGPESDLDETGCDMNSSGEPPNYTFGTSSGVTTHCFNNPGTDKQCRVTTDEYGGYSLSQSYNGQEPVSCTTGGGDTGGGDTGGGDTGGGDTGGGDTGGGDTGGGDTGGGDTGGGDTGGGDTGGGDTGGGDTGGGDTGGGDGDGDDSQEPEPCEGDDCEAAILKRIDDKAGIIVDSLTNKGEPILTDFSQAESLYESEYEDGFLTVWEDKESEFKNTEAVKFLDQFKFSGGGAAPNAQMCFNLGSNMNFGCAELPLPSAAIFAFIRIVILISAAFLCRRIIFGG